MFSKICNDPFNLKDALQFKIHFSLNARIFLNRKNLKLEENFRLKIENSKMSIIPSKLTEISNQGLIVYHNKYTLSIC